jgi:protein TonB
MHFYEKDSVLRKAFTISIIFHIFILLPWPGIIPFRESLKKKAKTEISPPIIYYKISQKINRINSSSEAKKIKVKKQKLPNKEKKYVKKDRKVLKKINKKVLPSYIEEKKGIVSLSKDLEKEKIPKAILSYYRAVREEIKKSAIANKPFGGGRGEVTVIFEVLSDGSLSDINLDQSRSVSNRILKKAALRSIKLASPFPPFPKEIGTDNITFSITIEFDLAP